MRFGRVLTYKDVDEAEKLEGKKVVASENLYLIENEAFCREYAKQYKLTLAGARKGLYPFTVSDDNKFPPSYDGNKFQFIREVIEEESDHHYEPYDLSNPAVRKSLRDRWIIWNDGDEDDADEAEVIGFIKREGDPWEVKTSIGSIDAAELMKFYVFDDGTPCGQLVYAGEGHMEGDASVRGD